MNNVAATKLALKKRIAALLIRNEGKDTAETHALRAQLEAL